MFWGGFELRGKWQGRHIHHLVCKLLLDFVDNREWSASIADCIDGRRHNKHDHQLLMLEVPLAPFDSNCTKLNDPVERIAFYPNIWILPNDCQIENFFFFCKNFQIFSVLFVFSFSIKSKIKNLNFCSVFDLWIGIWMQIDTIRWNYRKRCYCTVYMQLNFEERKMISFLAKKEFRIGQTIVLTYTNRWDHYFSIQPMWNINRPSRIWNYPLCIYHSDILILIWKRKSEQRMSCRSNWLDYVMWDLLSFSDLAGATTGNDWAP